MLQDLWRRITGRRREEAIERETEREQGSATERHLASESFEDLQADEFVDEHLGGGGPEDQPPRN